MKTTKVYLMMILCLIALIGCSEDDDVISSDELTVTNISVSVEDSVYVVLSGDYKKSESFTFTYADDWVVTGFKDSLFTISQKSGKAGDNTITISAKDYNCSDTLCTTTFSVTPVNKNDIAKINVCVLQKPAFGLDEMNIQVSPEGDTLHLKFNTDIEINESLIFVGNDFMMEKSTIEGNNIEIIIKPNVTDKIIHGAFCITMKDNDGKLIHSGFCNIEQPTMSSVSKDMYTEDGKVTRLLSHTKGKGIPIVIMGDGFLDVDITSGRYRSATKKAADAIFDRYPMSCLKDYFDIYEVTAVSHNNYFSDLSSTAFGCRYADRRTIDSHWGKIVDYARKAIDENCLKDAVILTLLNDSVYAGSCMMHSECEVSDIPSGWSIACLPVGDSNFEYTINHEVVGHGFAKLADEYIEFEGEIPYDEIEYTKTYQSYGFYRNLTFSNDVTKSYWAKLAADSRYAHEKLGCYEGGRYYPKGVWRPTDDSVMNGFVECFNAIGRLMIYKRCMNIAYGDKWKFDYEDFVNFEKANAQMYASSSKAKTRSASKKHLGSCVRIVESPKISQ